MARSFTAAQMAARVRYVTDTVNDTHITAAELYTLLTEAVANTWDKIQGYGLGDEGIKTELFNASADVIEYDIDTVAPDGDFYKLKTLYVNDGNGFYRPISRVSANEQYALKGPNSAIGMKLCYIPCAPTFVTGAESFDGINGWEEHAIQLVAIEVKKKKEDDAGQYKSAVREIEERMKTHANRNADDPPRVIRRRGAAAWAQKVAPYSGAVGGWNIRGSKLELYAPSFGLYL